MSRDEIAAIVDTAHERRRGVRAHVADRRMILECIELGVDIIDHGDEIDDEIIDKMVEAGTFWVPSLVYLWSLLEVGYAERFEVSAELTSMCGRCCPERNRPVSASSIGDDYSGVFRDVLDDDPLDHQVGNYGREFGFYAAIDGLSPAEVLTWGTSNAGEVLVDRRRRSVSSSRGHGRPDRRRWRPARRPLALAAAGGAEGGHP